MNDQEQEVSRLLDALAQGSEDARAPLMERIYGELRELARRRLSGLGAHGSIGSASLVHEVYLKLFDGRPLRWENRRHFFGIVGNAMRELAIDRLRRQDAAKRGGDRVRVALAELGSRPESRPEAEELLALDEALDRLAGVSPLARETVVLRFYAGLTHDEVAQALDVSRARVRREWAYARAFLHRELRSHRFS